VTLYDLFVRETNNAALQAFRYLFVGGFAAVVNIGTLALVKEAAGVNYLLANLAGFFTGLAANFALSKIFVFRERLPLGGGVEFLLHGAVSGAALLLDMFLMWLFTSVVGLYYLVSKIIATGIGVLWNFAGRKALYGRAKK